MRGFARYTSKLFHRQTSKHVGSASFVQKFWIKTFARPSGVRRRLLEMQYSH